METIQRQVEFRADGRKLSGLAMPYGDVSPLYNETFAPGSIVLADSVALNLRHNQLQAVAFYPGGGLSFDDGPEALRMSADLPKIPAADLALKQVREGRLSGLSVEFHSLAESRSTSGVRVVERARLVGLALCQDPAYLQTSVEARRRGWSGGRAPTQAFIAAKVAGRKKLACACSGPDCDSVYFEPGSMDEAATSDREILAIADGYAKSMASKRAGTLQIETDGAGGIAIALAPVAAETPAGAEIAAMAAAVPLLARPSLDLAKSEYTEAGGTRTFTKAHVRAIIIKPSDSEGSEGWDEVTINRPEAGPPRRKRSRGLYRWL